MSFNSSQFSNANGVTFGTVSGLSGNVVTASVNAGGTGGAGGPAISGGTNSQNTGTVNFSNSNGVSFGLNTNGVMTATVKTDYQASGNYLTTAMLSNAVTLSNIKISAGTLSALRSDISFNNSNGISFGLETNGIITGTVKTDYQTSGAYLTTAALSQDSSKYVGTNGAITGGSITVNTSGVSINLPAYLTTADLSANSSNYIRNWKLTGNSAGTSSSAQGTDLWLAGGNGVTISGSSNTLSFSVATNYQSQGAYLTTADLSQNSSKYAGINGAITGGSITVNTSGVSINLPAYLTTADLSANSSKYFINWKLTGNTSGTTSSAQGTDFWLAGGNGVTVSGSSNTISLSVATNYQSQGAYLTTAMASNRGSDFMGTNTALTANGVSMTANSSGLSLNFPAFLTTAMQSASSSVFAKTGFTTTSVAGAVVAGTLNTDGLKIAVPAYLTTAMASNAVGVYISAGANSQSTGTINFSNSNGISFGLSANGVMTAGVATAPAGSLFYSNGSGVTWGTSTAGASTTVTASVGVMGSWFANIDEWAGMVTGASGITQNSGSSIFVQPFYLPYSISAGYVRFLASFNDSAVGTAGTTSANTSFSAERYSTFGMVIYSQGTGASSRSIQSVTSTSAGITGRTVYTAGAQGSQYTISVLKTYPNSGAAAGNYNTSYAVSSASIVISSNSNTLFTGPRFLDISWAGSLAPGNYWMGFGHSTSSNTNSSNISFAGTAAMPITLAGISQSNVSVGVLGAATSASDHQLLRGLGVWTTNASAWSTGSIGLNSISQVVSTPVLPFQIIREA
jgi:hypothetical protein